MTDAADIERSLRRLSRGARLVHLHRRLNQAAGVDLDRPAYIALACLAEDGPLALSALAEASGVEVSTMSRLVDRLMAAGHVDGRRSSTDLRVTVLSLSHSGADLVERLKAVRRAALAQVLDGWTPDERVDFARLLDRFVSGLERAAESKLPRPHVGSHAQRAATAPMPARSSVAGGEAR